MGFKKAAKGAGEVYDLNARCDALRHVVWQLAPTNEAAHSGGLSLLFVRCIELH